MHSRWTSETPVHIEAARGKSGSQSVLQSEAARGKSWSQSVLLRVTASGSIPFSSPSFLCVSFLARSVLRENVGSDGVSFVVLLAWRRQRECRKEKRYFFFFEKVEVEKKIKNEVYSHLTLTPSLSLSFPPPPVPALSLFLALSLSLSPSLPLLFPKEAGEPQNTPTGNLPR